MSDDADYIVIRPAPDLPAGFLPPHINGRWYDRRDVPVKFPPPFDTSVSEAVAAPSDRFEVRDDGAVAEVWEVRP